MKNICIIGTGLIGGSLGLALRKKARNKYFITGLGRNTAKLKTAKRLGAVDAFTTDNREGVKDADIIVICLPVHFIAPTVKKILPFIKSGAVITDAGSVKGSVLREVGKVFQKSVVSSQQLAFIGAHPMAGSEKSGISSAKADLYAGASVVLIKNRNEKAFNIVKTMWLSVGARVIEMDMGSHDRAVALISHLPHMIAFGLSELAGGLARRIPVLSRLAAGSFKDLTRVASSNSADWASICGANKKEVSLAIDKFIAELKKEKTLLNKPRALERTFEKAKTARQQLLHKSTKGKS